MNMVAMTMCFNVNLNSSVFFSAVMLFLCIFPHVWLQSIHLRVWVCMCVQCVFRLLLVSVDTWKLIMTTRNLIMFETAFIINKVHKYSSHLYSVALLRWMNEENIILFCRHLLSLSFFFLHLTFIELKLSLLFHQHLYIACEQIYTPRYTSCFRFCCCCWCTDTIYV